MEEINLTGNKYELAVELASLVGNNPKLLIDFKKLKIFNKALIKLKKINEEKIKVILNDEESLELSSEEILLEIQKIKNYFSIFNLENTPRDGNEDISSLELDDLLKIEDLDEFTISRIKELFSDSEIKSIYLDELKKREKNFSIISVGNNYLKELLYIDKKIIKISNYILGLKVKAFSENKKISSQEASIIKKLNEEQSNLEIDKENFLQYIEPILAYRLYTLKNYKKQLNSSGFVITPSRKKYIIDIEEKLLTGKSILLTGGTGTGKTALAVNAIKNIQSSLVKVSGRKIQDEFVEVLSGNSGTRPSDFIAKVKLTEGKKGGTITSSELGKILKAFIEGKIPVIDEIDLIPTDVLMRIKHLFTLKPGDYYSPQENGNDKYLLKNTTLIATANIKSEKHEDREELDPAIVRLFDGININYFPEEEIYDLALTSLMSEKGFISNVGLSEISGDESILVRLIYALKDIEQNYLGFSDGETITEKGSDVSNIYLQKAVLETGKLMSFFKGFNDTENNFSKYIENQVIDFISNGAYPKTDRLLLLKIFTLKGIISDEKSLSLIIEKNPDINPDDIKKSIINSDSFLDNDSIKFIDPYELAYLNLSGTDIIDSLDYINNDTKIIDLFREIDIHLNYEDGDESESEYSNALEEKLSKIFNDYSIYNNLNLKQKDKEDIMGILYELKEFEYIERLGMFNEFKDEYTKIEILREKEEQEEINRKEQEEAKRKEQEEAKRKEQEELNEKIDKKYEKKEKELKLKKEKLIEIRTLYSGIKSDLGKNLENIKNEIVQFNKTDFNQVKKVTDIKNDDYFIPKVLELLETYFEILKKQKGSLKEKTIRAILLYNYRIEIIDLDIKKLKEKNIEINSDLIIEREKLYKDMKKTYEDYISEIEKLNKLISDRGTIITDELNSDELDELLENLKGVDKSSDELPISFNNDGQLNIPKDIVDNIFNEENIPF